MEIITLVILAIGLSMDCFTVSIGAGVTNKNIKGGQVVLISAIFGLSHFLMPLLGWLIGDTLRNYISAFDYWVAFSLLTIIGVKMISDAFKVHKNSSYVIDKALVVIMLAIATSIDAFILGMPLALLNFPLVVSAMVISIFAFMFSVLGFYIGKSFGFVCRHKAGIMGGIILIIIGVKILLENIL